MNKYYCRVIKNKTLYLGVLLLSLQVSAVPSNILIASIPKCGTQLLQICINLISPEIKFKHAENDHLVITDKDVKTKKAIIGHALPTAENIERLKKAGFKVVFIFRDPRDQAVSMINMVKRKKWFPRLVSKSFDEALSQWIFNTSELYWGINHWINPELKDFKGIDDLYHRYFEWTKFGDDFVYVTSYEKLAGAYSGGSSDVQVRELKNIARHIGIDLSHERALELSEQTHGEIDPNGRKRIGSWRRYFKPHHVEEFKDVAGDLLIDLGYEKNSSWNLN